jgi:hypothetical protein
MGRRTALGLFTQWSGNTPIPSYLDKFLIMNGYTDTHTKKTINPQNTAWSFVHGTSYCAYLAAV